MVSAAAVVCSDLIGAGRKPRMHAALPPAKWAWTIVASCIPTRGSHYPRLSIRFEPHPRQRVAAVLLATLASAAAFVPASFKAPAARTRGYVCMVWATRIRELKTAPWCSAT